MKIIDLSVTIANNLPVDPPRNIPQINYITHEDEASITTMQVYFPGLKKEDLLDGHGWASEGMNIKTHVGTHMDAPYHYHPTMNHGEPAWTIDEVPLEWCIGNGVVVDFSDKPDGYLCTSKDFIEYFKNINYTLQPNDIVLLRTSAHTQWGNEKYLVTGCGVGKEGTLWLCDQGVHTVGTDAWSWDPPLSITAKLFAENHDASIVWEGHKAGAEKAYLQIEKLTNLDKLPKHGFTFVGFPIKIERASAGWIRAVAILNE